MATRIPKCHTDSLSTIDVVLTTISQTGYPQSTLVLYSYDDECVLVNTGIDYQREKNMMCNPRDSVLAIDPPDKMRWIDVHGDAELVEENALEHLNRLANACGGRTSAS